MMVPNRRKSRYCISSYLVWNHGRSGTRLCCFAGFRRKCITQPITFLQGVNIYIIATMYSRNVVVIQHVGSIVLTEVVSKASIWSQLCCQLGKMSGPFLGTLAICSPLGVKWNHVFHNTGPEHPSCHTFTTIQLQHSAFWLLLKLHYAIQTQTKV